MASKFKTPMAQRFRGFLPVVVDVETGGLDPKRDALLEIAAIPIAMDDEGLVHPQETIAYHIEPFPKANIDPEALKINGIKPFHPFRLAIPEEEALNEIFTPIHEVVKATGCDRAILVGHNAHFDLDFLNAAIKRCKIKKSPFHAFSSLDTVSLAGLAYGQTVLARAMKAANLAFDTKRAHSAIYDTEATAALFCKIVNQWQTLGGWPLQKQS